MPTHGTAAAEGSGKGNARQKAQRSGRHHEHGWSNTSGAARRAASRMAAKAYARRKRYAAEADAPAKATAETPPWRSGRGDQRSQGPRINWRTATLGQARSNLGAPSTGSSSTTLPGTSVLQETVALLSAIARHEHGNQGQEVQAEPNPKGVYHRSRSLRKKGSRHRGHKKERREAARAENLPQKLDENSPRDSVDWGDPVSSPRAEKRPRSPKSNKKGPGNRASDPKRASRRDRDRSCSSSSYEYEYEDSEGSWHSR